MIQHFKQYVISASTDESLIAGMSQSKVEIILDFLNLMLMRFKDLLEHINCKKSADPDRIRSRIVMESN